MAKNKNPRRGIIQTLLITRQIFGENPTYCKRCKKRLSFKMIRGDASYTLLCNCGCTLVQYHRPDKYHKTCFWTTQFIPAKKFDPKHKNKDQIERLGFEKTEKNGAKIYEK